VVVGDQTLDTREAMKVKVYLDDGDKPEGTHWAGSAAFIARELSGIYDVTSVLVMLKDSTHTVSYWQPERPVISSQRRKT
jgi:hypothetical protein